MRKTKEKEKKNNMEKKKKQKKKKKKKKKKIIKRGQNAPKQGPIKSMHKCCEMKKKMHEYVKK